MVETYFTDEEYRLVLRALSREREVCEKVDKDCCANHKLIHIMNSIDKKTKYIQYHKPIVRTPEEIAEMMEKLSFEPSERVVLH